MWNLKCILRIAEARSHFKFFVQTVKIMLNQLKEDTGRIESLVPDVPRREREV